MKTTTVTKARQPVTVQEAAAVLATVATISVQIIRDAPRTCTLCKRPKTACREPLSAECFAIYAEARAGDTE